MLLTLINHCGNDAYLAISLMFKIEVLPLTKHLTNVCGNLWYCCPARWLVGELGLMFPSLCPGRAL